MARDRLAALRSQQQPALEQESFPATSSVPVRPRLNSRASFEDTHQVYSYRSPSPEPDLGPFSNPFSQPAQPSQPREPPQAQLPIRRPSDPMGTPRASQQFSSQFDNYSMSSREHSGRPAQGTQQRRASTAASQRRTHAYQTSNAHVQNEQHQKPSVQRRDTQMSTNSGYSAYSEVYASSIAHSLDSRDNAPLTAGRPNSEQYGLGVQDAVDTSMESFFDELTVIQNETRDYDEALTRIEALHSRELNTVPDSNEAQRVTADLARVSNDATRLSASLKRRIQTLERTNGLGREISNSEKNVKRTQTAGAKNRFISAVQRYSSIEAAHRAACRQRFAKQYRVVNPNATEAEIIRACEAPEGGIFTQAMLSSGRTEGARNALNAVQARQAELARIEQTITELAQLFNDMAFMVEEQHEQILEIEEKAGKVEVDMEAAHTDLVHAKQSAKSARNKRKWFCIIISVILLIIAIIVTLVVLKQIGIFNHTSTAAAVAAPADNAQDLPTSAVLSSTIAPVSTASTTSTPISSSIPTTTSQTITNLFEVPSATVSSTVEPKTVTVVSSIVSVVTQTVVSTTTRIASVAPAATSSVPKIFAMAFEGNP